MSIKAGFPQHLKVTLSYLILSKLYSSKHRRRKQKAGCRRTSFLYLALSEFFPKTDSSDPVVKSEVGMKFFFQLPPISTTQNASQFSSQAVLKLVVSSLLRPF